MVHRENRVRASRDFVRVYRGKRAFVNKYLVLYLRANGLDRTRFGFSVSKKVGKAVARNRTRRRLKEMCRRHLGELRTGYDLVIIARPLACSAPHDKLRGALRHLFHSAGLFAQGSRPGEGDEDGG